MTPDELSRDLVRKAPLIRRDDKVGDAVRQVLDSGLPALPVVDRLDPGVRRRRRPDPRSAGRAATLAGDGRLVGIFGEREFVEALFPGYLKELSYAGFVPGTLDDAIEKRAGCRHESVGVYMNTEHIDVGPDFSDAQVAETFLHHPVPIVPVVDSGEVQGIITRGDFFRLLGERFLEQQ